MSGVQYGPIYRPNLGKSKHATSKCCPSDAVLHAHIDRILQIRTWDMKYCFCATFMALSFQGLLKSPIHYQLVNECEVHSPIAFAAAIALQ